MFLQQFLAAFTGGCFVNIFVLAVKWLFKRSREEWWPRLRHFFRRLLGLRPELDVELAAVPTITITITTTTSSTPATPAPKLLPPPRRAVVRMGRIPTADEIRDIIQEAWVPRDRVDGAWNSQEEYLRTHYEHR